MKVTKWKPKNIDVFAGVVDYPVYNFFDKFMIRLIMWITSGPTDTKVRFEFTDWNRVKKFAEVLILKIYNLFFCYFKNLNLA